MAEDTNSDERVSYTEFIRWLFHGGAEAVTVAGERQMMGDCIPLDCQICQATVITKKVFSGPSTPAEVRHLSPLNSLRVRSNKCVCVCLFLLKAMTEFMEFIQELKDTPPAEGEKPTKLKVSWPTQKDDSLQRGVNDVMEMAFVLIWIRTDLHLLRTSSKRWTAPLMHQNFHDMSHLFWTVLKNERSTTAESSDLDCWHLEMTFCVAPRKRQRQDFFHRVQVETWQKVLISRTNTATKSEVEVELFTKEICSILFFFSYWFVFHCFPSVQGHLIIGLWPWRWSAATQLNYLNSYLGWTSKPDGSHRSVQPRMQLVFALPG